MLSTVSLLTSFELYVIDVTSNSLGIFVTNTYSEYPPSSSLTYPIFSISNLYSISSWPFNVSPFVSDVCVIFTAWIPPLDTLKFDDVISLFESSTVAEYSIWYLQFSSVITFTASASIPNAL